MQSTKRSPLTGKMKIVKLTFLFPRFVTEEHDGSLSEELTLEELISVILTFKKMRKFVLTSYTKLISLNPEEIDRFLR